SRAENARRPLRPVLRSRPSTSRADSPRVSGRDACRRPECRGSRANIHFGGTIEVGTVRRLRARRCLAHLDRIRPYPVPAVVTAALGARSFERGGAALATGSKFPNRILGRRESCDRVHGGAFNHAIAG